MQGHGGAGRKLQVVGFDDAAVLRHRPLPAESERPGLTPLGGSLLPLGQARAAPLVCQRERPEGPRPLPGGRGRGAALPADRASSVLVGELLSPRPEEKRPRHTHPHQTPPGDPDREPGRSGRCPSETCHGTGSHKTPPNRPPHRHTRWDTPSRPGVPCLHQPQPRPQPNRQAAQQLAAVS